jgi:selenophosphate synthetase-related protein
MFHINQLSLSSGYKLNVGITTYKTVHWIHAAREKPDVKHVVRVYLKMKVSVVLIGSLEQPRVGH